MLSEPNEILYRNASEQIIESNQSHSMTWAFLQRLTCLPLIFSVKLKLLSSRVNWCHLGQTLNCCTIASLSVQDFKRLLCNIQSEFSLSDCSSNEILRLLSVTLPPKTIYPATADLLRIRNLSSFSIKKQWRLKKAAWMSLMLICRFKKRYQFMAWSFFRQEMSTWNIWNFLKF